MYGTLRGALAGRKIEFDRDGYTASVEGRIVGIGKTIRIASIHVHYELAVPADAREATERALAAASSGVSRPSERQGRHRHHLGGHAPGRRGGADRPQRGWVARTTREQTTARGGRVTRHAGGRVLRPPPTPHRSPGEPFPTPWPLCRSLAGRKGSEDPFLRPRRVTLPVSPGARSQAIARWLGWEALPRVHRAPSCSIRNRRRRARTSGGISTRPASPTSPRVAR